MRRSAGLLVVALFSFAIPSRPQDAPPESLAGHWEGAYVRRGAIQRVSVDFIAGADGLEGTYDIPDLSIYGESIQQIDYRPPILIFKPKYGVFTMHVFDDVQEMTGVNDKWNPPVRLHLKRTVKDPSLPYRREDVVFDHGGIHLGGTLYEPIRSAPYPGVVVVQGSGAQGRETYYYRFWGDFFARHGVAALIYDKRGVGASSGDFTKATFDDLAGDASAAAELLRRRQDIDPKRIGLFGISQGGWLAPLAASRTPAVKFLILDVGPAVSVREQELDRVEYSMRADGAPKEDIEAALAYTKWAFEAAYTGRGQDELEARLRAAHGQPWAKYVQLVESAGDLEDWARIRYDPAPVLKKTTLPILCLFGEKDLLVPPQTNEAKMRAYLRTAGDSDVTIQVIPGVGHDMERFATLEGGAWQWPDEFWVWARKSQRFYQAIVDWLVSHGMTSG